MDSDKTKDVNQRQGVLSSAKNIQQLYYELLPDWSKYEKDDYEILQQNIGYALFGPPTESIEEENVKNDKESSCLVNYMPGNVEDLTSINEAIKYSKKVTPIISAIFEQIINNSEQPDGVVYCGIIYNIIFNESNQKKNINKKTEIQEENKIYEDVQAVPIFKIRNPLKINQATSKSTVDTYDTWYIDNGARLYKNWEDYKRNNKLPPCTMVLPKDGLYQPNPEYEITENYSTVWVETLSSPASSLSSKIVNSMDKASTLLNIGILGITVTSMVTPIAPAVALTGLATTGFSGAWTFGRSVQHIIDRGLHKESISPTNRNALSAWLGIAGSTVGLATSGGSMLLSKAAQAGRDIGLTARVAYNTTVISNISINLVGLGYNGYCIYEKYQEDNRIDAVDIFFFTTHVMFFGNAVVGAKFANEVIANSQGNIIKDYEASLRNKRHRKAFNRVKRNAPTTTEIVRYVRRVKTRTELFTTNNSDVKQCKTLENTSSKNTSLTNNIINNIKFKKGKLKYKDITLLDPLIFISNCTHISQFGNALLLSTGHSNYTELCATLLKLLADYYTNYPFSCDLITPSQFQSIIKDMEYLTNAKDVFEKIFHIAEKLVKKSFKLYPFLDKIVCFIWEYGKVHLKQKEPQDLLNIFSYIHSQLEIISDHFLAALHQYLNIQ